MPLRKRLARLLRASANRLDPPMAGYYVPPIWTTSALSNMTVTRGPYISNRRHQGI